MARAYIQETQLEQKTRDTLSEVRQMKEKDPPPEWSIEDAGLREPHLEDIVRKLERGAYNHQQLMRTFVGVVRQCRYEMQRNQELTKEVEQLRTEKRGVKLWYEND